MVKLGSSERLWPRRHPTAAQPRRGNPTWNVRVSRSLPLQEEVTPRDRETATRVSLPTERRRERSGEARHPPHSSISESERPQGRFRRGELSRLELGARSTRRLLIRELGILHARWTSCSAKAGRGRSAGVRASTGTSHLDWVDPSRVVAARVLMRAFEAVSARAEKRADVVFVEGVAPAREARLAAERVELHQTGTFTRIAGRRESLQQFQRIARTEGSRLTSLTGPNLGTSTPRGARATKPKLAGRSPGELQATNS